MTAALQVKSCGQTESDLQTKLSAALFTVALASHGHKVTILKVKLAASTSRAEARKQHVSELQTKLSAALATQAETCEQPLLPPPVASAGWPDPSTSRPESVLPTFSSLNRAAKSAELKRFSERLVLPSSSSSAPVPPAAFRGPSAL